MSQTTVNTFVRDCRSMARRLRAQLDALENGPTIYDRGHAIVQIDRIPHPILCKLNIDNYEEVLNEVLGVM